ncbi:MAG TPA: hypothetical protein VM165_02570 [Planctomycetaceae bacterium]|nr:hypothetical protein [Planctomycetaceae bacterium]
MVYLYGIKSGSRHLVATFDSDAQLRACVSWCTLRTNADGTAKFEQGSALATVQRWESSVSPLTDEDPASVVHNPTPSML